MTLRLIGPSALRAGLYPAAVLVGYLLARARFGERVSLGPLNIATHFVGGLAVAHLFAVLVAPVADACERRLRAVVRLVGIVALTATMAVSWEFMECLVARVAHVRGPSRRGDTLRDIAAGMAGACAYAAVLLVLRQRRECQTR